MRLLMKKAIKEEIGSGLILSLMVLVVLAVLGSALGMITVGSYRLGHANQDSMSAYYIAEAGANMAYEEMKSIVEQKYKDNETYDAFFTAMDTPLKNTEGLRATKKYAAGYFSPQMGDVPEADVKVTGGTIVESEGAQGKERVKNYIIESTGQVDGKTRTVEREVEITWRDKVKAGSNIPLPLNDAAITVNGDLTANVMPTVNGGAVYKTKDGKFKIDNKNQGKNFKGDNVTKDISSDEWIKLSNLDNVLPDIPTINIDNKLNNYKTDSYTIEAGSKLLEMTENTYMPKLIIRNTGTLNVDTDGKTLTLFIDEMNLDNATIKVAPEGKLTIVLTGNNQMSITNSFSFNGSLVSPKSDIKNGTSFEVTGDVISGGHIDLSNGPKITGNVYANGHIEMRGNGTSVTGDLVASGHITLYDAPRVTGNVYSNGHINMHGQDTTVNGLIISTKDIKFHNKSILNALVLAPNGNFSMQDNSILTGSIVAKTINFSNDVTVTHSLDYLKYLPGGASSGAGTSEIGMDDLISSTPAIEN